MRGWKLTVRHGSQVARERFNDLETAIGELERQAEEVRGEGGLKRVSSLRDFEPEEQVHARLEISGRRLVRPPTAGVDVRGDGSMVAFAGAVRRQELDSDSHATVFDAVRDALRGSER